MKKLKNALIGLAGLAATAVPNQDANAQFQREQSPHIQQKIEEIRNQQPLGNYEIRSSLITPLMIPTSKDSSNVKQNIEQNVEQKHQHDHDILKQRGASKEVLVFEDKDNNINYTIPFTQGQDTLKLASINPNNDYFLNLRNSQKFFEYTNPTGVRTRESLEQILNEGGTIRLPGHAKLEGEDGNLLYITGPNKEPGVVSYAIGRKDNDESVRFVTAHLGDIKIEEYLQDTEKIEELQEEVNGLHQKLDDKNQYLSQKKDVISQQEREIDVIKEQLGKRNYSIGANAVVQTGQNDLFGAEVEAGLGNWYVSGGFLSTLGSKSSTDLQIDTKHHPRMPSLNGVSLQKTVLEERARAFTAGVERNVGTPLLSVGAMMKYSQQEEQGSKINETFFENNGDIIDHQRTTSGIDNVANRMFYGPRATLRFGPLNINANVTTDFKGNYNVGGGIGARFGGSRK